MDIRNFIKPAFSVIGKEGSTEQGEGFIRELWDDANADFFEVYSLAKRDEQNRVAGVWGAMTDFGRSFQPWEDFCKGLYLAGVECMEEAEAPEGWTKWEIPGFEYLQVEDGAHVFQDMLRYLEENNLPLVGAVQEFTDPGAGKSYLLFPIRRL